MEKTERLENLERAVSSLLDRYNKLENTVNRLENTISALEKRVSQAEVTLTNTQLKFSPYQGNAFQSPYGNPFRYTTVTPIQSVNEIPNQNDIQSSSIIIQKLDRIIDLFNNNFSRLNWRLEALENQRKE